MLFVENYSSVKKFYANNTRTKIRHLTLSGLSSWESLIFNVNKLEKPRIQFLYLHHVFKDEEDKLELLLQNLANNHKFISYSEAVEQAIQGNINEPGITLSFDDGFRNNLKAGLILKKYNAKACFFLNPSVIGVTNANVIKKYCQTKLNFPPVEFLNWDEVDSLQQMGHEIGGHTMAHMNMAKASPEEIFEDLQISTAILTNKCGSIRHFAFPYGSFNHFSNDARKAVFDSGYQSCASVIRGCYFPHNKPFIKEHICILRDHIILDWPLSHSLYFISRNSRKKKFDTHFPYLSEAG